MHTYRVSAGILYGVSRRENRGRMSITRTFYNWPYRPTSSHTSDIRIVQGLSDKGGKAESPARSMSAWTQSQPAFNLAITLIKVKGAPRPPVTLIFSNTGPILPCSSARIHTIGAKQKGRTSARRLIRSENPRDPRYTLHKLQHAVKSKRRLGVTHERQK